jgi:hypothetical protein
MGPAKKEKTAPSGRELMTAQQKKDADIANMGAKAASKAAAGDAPKVKTVDKDAARAAGQGGSAGKAKNASSDLSFLDAALKKK